MRAKEFITESKTTLNNMYGGHFPDRDEEFWDYVTPRELGQALTVETMQKHKVLIMLLSQYRAEHIDDITDILDDDQQAIVQSYINDPALSSKTIVVANNKIIDGNHRALAAAIKGVPINYVDLAELDEETIDEAELDSTGWGATPQGTDVDYFGIKVKMRPSTFLKLSHPLNAGEQNSDVEKHMQGGGKIAYPFLEIKDPVEWEDGDFSQQGKVVNHEGRNRMTHWIKMKGDEPIQVNVFLRGANRRRYVTDDMIQALSQGLISQTGQLVKNPFEVSTALDEADSKSQYAHEITLKLQDAGYKKLGIGADSTVWAKDDSYVIKILMPDDPNSQAEKVFQKFYEFCQQHPKLSVLPKFNEVNTIDIGGKDYTQIEMEKLTPIVNNTFEEAMVWALSDMVSENLSWDNVVKELLNPNTWNGAMTRVMRKMPMFVTQRMNSPEFNKTYSQLYEVMRQLYQTGQINKFGWDLHTENVMQRSNGQLVIIDPWFIATKGSR
jgi:hypothetical protein